MAILNSILDFVSYILDIFTSVDLFAILFWAFLLVSVVLGILKRVYN